MCDTIMNIEYITIIFYSVAFSYTAHAFLLDGCLPALSPHTCPCRMCLSFKKLMSLEQNNALNILVLQRLESCQWFDAMQAVTIDWQSSCSGLEVSSSLYYQIGSFCTVVFFTSMHHKVQ